MLAYIYIYIYPKPFWNFQKGLFHSKDVKTKICQPDSLKNIIIGPVAVDLPKPAANCFTPLCWRCPKHMFHRCFRWRFYEPPLHSTRTLLILTQSYRSIQSMGKALEINTAQVQWPRFTCDSILKSWWTRGGHLWWTASDHRCWNPPVPRWSTSELHKKFNIDTKKSWGFGKCISGFKHGFSKKHDA